LQFKQTGHGREFADDGHCLLLVDATALGEVCHVVRLDKVGEFIGGNLPAERGGDPLVLDAGVLQRGF